MTARVTRARRWGVGVAAAGVLLSAAACSTTTIPEYDLKAATPTATEEEADGSADAPVTDCGDPLASYEPEETLPEPGDFAPGSTMAEILDRGRLVVGVSSDTLLMGARDPLTGEISGFDIDILREVAEAIFGDREAIQFRVITSGQRLEVLENHEVDLVARAMTMNCARWASIAFSSEYYRAGQKVLVTKGSGVERIEDLAGMRVCAPEGTTTLERLADYPDIEAVPARTHGECLVYFQQGVADAITGDDTVLAGFAAQDPYTQVVGEAISDEPYGLGIPADQIDLVRFVNGVLDRMRADGTWAEIYGRWLSGLGAAPEPPAAVYGRES